jgi:hypothetical protein
VSVNAVHEQPLSYGLRPGGPSRAVIIA